jgi:uncharacterized protein YbjT (DUF2867 family)
MRGSPFPNGPPTRTRCSDMNDRKPRGIAEHWPKEADVTGNARNKTFVVVGATGRVGRVVASKLQSLGHQVRPVARSLGMSFERSDKLDEVFSGANGAYLMIPFDVAAPDLHRREDEIGDARGRAVAASGVPRVVLLSGLSAHLREAIVGSAKGAAMMEQRLNAMNIGELVHLRATFWMENLLQGVAQMANTGTFAGAFSGDKPMPMIAAKDVGVRAAEILVAKEVGPRVQELHGARDYTMAEAVSILGASVGLRNARYIQLPYEEARAGMIGAGVSPSLADAVMQTARGFNEGRVWAREARSSQNTTETTLETFAAETFAPAYRAAVEKSGR